MDRTWKENNSLKENDRYPHYKNQRPSSVLRSQEDDIEKKSFKDYKLKDKEYWDSNKERWDYLNSQVSDYNTKLTTSKKEKNLRDREITKAVQDILADNQEYVDLLKKAKNAKRYADYAEKSGWKNTVVKQKKLADTYEKQAKDIFEATKKQYIEENNIDDIEFPKELDPSVYSEIVSISKGAEDIKKDYKDKQNKNIEELRAKDNKERREANAELPIYVGYIKDNPEDYSPAGPYKDFFQKDGDRYYLIDFQAYDEYPYGSNRGYSKTYAKPDARKYFKSFSENELENLQSYNTQADKYIHIGDWDSTD